LLSRNCHRSPPAIGPRLNDGSYLVLAGTDNDHSVTQNGTSDLANFVRPLVD
jgi:hypothetical protein